MVDPEGGRYPIWCLEQSHIISPIATRSIFESHYDARLARRARLNRRDKYLMPSLGKMRLD